MDTHDDELLRFLDQMVAKGHLKTVLRADGQVAWQMTEAGHAFIDAHAEDLELAIQRLLSPH